MNHQFSLSARVPDVSSRPCLKILGSGEIVQWKHFSEITQLYDVESATGKVFSIQSNKVSQQVSPDEAAEFGRRQNIE